MNASPPVAGVVVTFHPDAQFERRLEAVAREVSPLLVVDNTAEPVTQARLVLACRAVNARLIANQENRGLASALNQAFAAFAAQGVEWAVAFDQDSTPEPGFSRALLAAATSPQASPPAAVTGANWRDAARPEQPARHLQRHFLPLLFRRPTAGRDLDNVTCVITSGSLFHLPAWRNVGGFDESLFLDLVDTDYCLRVRHAGYAVRVAAAAPLLHHRGAKQPVRFAGRTWWPAFMPPSRLHYLFRNRILVLGQDGWRVPHWVAFEVVYAGKIVAEILLLEDRKAAKLAACAHGTWDGLLGRRGRAS